MRKLTCALVMAAVLAAIPGVSMALELDEECLIWNTPPFGGLNGEGLGWLNFLKLLEVEEVMEMTWPDADMDTIAEFMDGDGIPDQIQMALLAAVLCDAAAKEIDGAAIQAQLDANVDEVDAMIARLIAMFTAMGPVGAAMTSVGENLILAGGGLEALGIPMAQMTEYPDPEAEEDGGYGALLSAFSEEYGGAIGMFLPPNATGIAALAGLSSEGNMTINLLLVDLMEEWEGYDVLLLGLAGQLDYYAPMAGPLQASMEALADDIEAFAPLMVSSAVPPVLDILGKGAKADGDEPFAADGDIDGDGSTNLDVYEDLEARGIATPGSFVKGASGSWTAADPWPAPGSDLPVAGLLGLSVLAGACALAGARIIRKK